MHHLNVQNYMQLEERKRFAINFLNRNENNNFNHYIHGGLREGSWNLIVGQTGVGKSEFMINVFLDYLKQGHPVIFCTAELTLQAFMDRLISVRLGLSEEYCEKKENKMKDTRIIQFLAKMEQYNEFIFHSCDVEEVFQEIEIRYELCEKPPIVFIDHIHHLESQKFKTEQEISNFYMSKVKTLMAKKVTFVAAAQFRKDDKTRDYRTLDDIKGDSSIKNTADYVFYVHRTKEQIERNRTVSLEDGWQFSLHLMKARSKARNYNHILSFDPKTSTTTYLNALN